MKNYAIGNFCKPFAVSAKSFWSFLLLHRPQGAPLKSRENQTQKTRSELAIAEDKGKSGGESAEEKARRRKRGGEKRRKGRKKESLLSFSPFFSSLLRAFSSALSPPLFPFSSAIANSLLVFCVWFSLLFKGAPCA